MIFAKNSLILDGMEVYNDPEGWSPYSCEVPICSKEGEIIETGYKYETSCGEVLVLSKELIKRGAQFIWLWKVQDEDGDEWEVYTYEFLRIAF